MMFFKGFIAAILTITVFWLFLLISQISRPTLSSQWIADAYEHKTKLAQKIQGQKILIVAGSSSLFGLDSKALEQAYQIPVVNFSVNAGLLLPFVLLKSQEVLKKGDIVIMPLEYHFYTYDGIPNVQMIDQIFSREPSFFWKLSLKEQWHMLRLTSITQLYKGFLAKGGQKTMIGPYGYANLDDHGDQTHTSKEEAIQWAYDWEALKKELPRHYGQDAHNKEGWRWLKDYAQWAKEEGIHLIITPPTMMFDPFYKNDPVEKAFYEGLKVKVESLGISFVGDPYTYMYEREVYFNTDYHLTDIGRTIWTQALIKDLKTQ
ncbi:MAG: hypothetical protein PHE60_02515 [Sulfurospirillaceae bacterium]|nr:hypothetical protein [Sulfurospirillaceae bacterium]